MHNDIYGIVDKDIVHLVQLYYDTYKGHGVPKRPYHRIRSRQDYEIENFLLYASIAGIYSILLSTDSQMCGANLAMT